MSYHRDLKLGLLTEALMPEKNNMKIYIGYDFDSNPISILLADSKEKAEIAWAGMKDTPHKIEELDPSQAKGVHGVVFLLTSKEYQIYNMDRDKKVRVFKRGL